LAHKGFESDGSGCAGAARWPAVIFMLAHLERTGEGC